MIRKPADLGGKLASAVKSLRNRFFAIPFVAVALLLLTWDRQLPWPILLGLGLVLVLTVFVAVHHAEVVALRVGEPFGTLILAVAVTIIEVGMIVILMLDNPEKTLDLARDTVFAAVMITINGILGGSLLIKTLKNRVANFKAEGVVGALAVLAALSVLSLVLPSFTTSSPGPTFTPVQLSFAAVTSLVLYLTFVAMQTVRHRDYFLPPARPNTVQSDNEHVLPPSTSVALLSVGGLVISLVAVVGLAKVSSPLIQGVVNELGFPQMVVAVSIAMVVLLPESISAFKAASFGRTQTSLNLALGSALASIGLTIPAIAIVSSLLGLKVNLGLGATDIVFLMLTLLVAALTLIPGRATLLQGVVHLSIFGAFLMVVVMP
jgi:Ca2+:H+ antiporter